MELGIAALLALAAVAQVRHDHLHGGGDGTLRVNTAGIVFEEPAQPKHSTAWSWDSIQQLELTDTKLRILTYEDSKWKGGRDREYEFAVSSTLAEYNEVFASHLGAKYIAAFALAPVKPQWQLPAKLHERLGGSDGTLYFTGDQLIYRSPERGESRTWLLSQIESISTSNPYELHVATFEKAGWTRGAREFRFQLKSPLSESAYQVLWKAVTKSK